MYPRRDLTSRTVGLFALFLVFGSSEVSAQLGSFGGPAVQRTRGTYGPRMSFGEFGYRLNSGYAFGNPYGGLARFDYGFGSAFGTGYPPGGMQIYTSGYVTPGAGLAAGFYPPWAVYAGLNPNPAVFPYPGPNHGTPRPSNRWPR
jgi:hypothetical protein